MGSEKFVGGLPMLRTWHSYDNDNRLSSQGWQIGADSFSQTYAYDTWDGNLSSMQSATGQTLTYGYDGLRRLSTVSGSVYDKSYTYRDISATQTTNQVAGLVYDLPTDRSFAYTYDNMGNIATYTDSNGTVTYTYDALGQLTKAEGSTTYEYSYDNAGNILSANGHTYTYGDSTWADLLTAVDGHAITYDPAGNPTSYYNGTNWTFTWEHGRNLATAVDGTNAISYIYDVDGLRTSKTVNGTKHTYYYAGGTLLRETYGDTVLDFFYAGGTPYALKYNGTLYYYITNLQGDVMSIVDAQGNVVAVYIYDPYGNVVTATGDLAEVNPLRYRGYYYDTEMGMYYLQSRYYDPELGRFINADAYTTTGQGILGNNMFAYCNNNPANMRDIAGLAPVYIVKEVRTEVEEENEDGVIYRTTIIFIIYDPDVNLFVDSFVDQVYECTYTVTNSGIIVFDNASNNTSVFAESGMLRALAKEMRDIAQEQVDGALQGRTISGIALELLGHAVGSFCGVRTDRTDVTQIGSNVLGSTGYDNNADWFEHPIKNLPTIISEIFPQKHGG